jgi:hypothetical protein
VSGPALEWVKPGYSQIAADLQDELDCVATYGIGRLVECELLLGFERCGIRTKELISAIPNFARIVVNLVGAERYICREGTTALDVQSELVSPVGDIYQAHKVVVSRGSADFERRNSFSS